MLQPALFLLVGLVVLLASGESLVRGAANLARIANIPPLIIGLTIVAFGTSAPELVVTIRAVMTDASGIAMGNIVGSNIANVLLVLGLPAIIMPISMNVPKLRRHAVFLLVATGVFCGLTYRSGGVAGFEAAVFASVMAVYFVMMVFEARGGNADVLEEAQELVSDHPRLPPTLLLVLVGLVGLPVGATLLVENGEILARGLGVRDEVIGLTIVAFGTSLPELATVIAAAMKRHASVAAGSIIGSNIFNLLFVGSAAGFVGTSTFTPAALHIDLPVMVAATLLVAALVFTRSSYSRALGVLSTLAYVSYIAFTGTAAL